MSSLQQKAQWLVQEWAARLAQTVEAATGDVPFAEWEETEAVTGMQADDFCWRQAFTLPGQPELWIGVPESTADAVGRRIRELCGIQPDRASSQGSWKEILTQSLAGLAQTLGARMEREVLCADGGPNPNPPPHSVAYRVKLLMGETELAPILVAPSTAMLSALPEPKPAPVPPPAAAPAAQEMEFQLPSSKTLDLLMDVELPVSVSFGRAQLALKDVIKLTTGAIVELNRSIAEPVEVIVNNCVVARGEVVVIEGNYGVRIQEIVSRQERLRTLY